ncbi:MAG TPA: hypothetical protein VFH73_17405, partial [Polyangia bacterium]|nr:hypothetical protein [Polyangia bacterium]
MSDDDDSSADDELQFKLDEGWQALEQGDRATARRVADAIAAQATARGGAVDPALAPALLLQAACFRDEGDDEQAIPL